MSEYKIKSCENCQEKKECADMQGVGWLCGDCIHEQLKEYARQRRELVRLQRKANRRAAFARKGKMSIPGKK